MSNRRRSGHHSAAFFGLRCLCLSRLGYELRPLLSGRESELFTKSKISVYLDPVVKSLFDIIVAGIGALLHFIVSCQASGDSAFGPNPTWLTAVYTGQPANLSKTGRIEIT